MSYQELSPDEHLRIWARLKSKRGNWEGHWQECADYVIPFKNNIQSKDAPGTKKGIFLYDSTAQMASELLAAALQGYLISPSSQFFGFTSGDLKLDRDDEVRRWFQDCSRRMRIILNQSNYQTEEHEFFVDQTWCGTSAKTVEEDDQFVVRFKTWHISEYVFLENNLGLVDVTYREFDWTAKQIVEEYGLENCGKEVKKAIDAKEFDKEFKIVVCVYPRGEKYTKSDAGTKGYKFGSKHILECDKTELRESGYHENPWVVTRWSKVSGEEYGRSCAMKVLPDIKMVNEMAYTMLEGAQKAVNPPVAMPHEAYLLPLKLKANGVNYRMAGGVDDKIEPIFNDTRIDWGEAMMERVRNRVREGFYVEQLQLGSGGPMMTATEVLQRTEERLKFMGPIMGRQYVENLNPTMTTTFSIMQRRGLFAPMPAKLSKRKIAVRYSSPISRAQSMSEFNSIIKALTAMSPMAQIQPEAMDVFNAEEGVRYLSEIADLPAEMIRDIQQIQAIRQGRAQAQKQAAEMGGEAARSEVAKNTAPMVAALANLQKNQSGQPVA